MAHGFSPSLSGSLSFSASSSFSHGDSDLYLQPAPEDIHFALNINKVDKDYQLKLKANISIPIKNLMNARDEYKILIDAYLDVAKQRLSNEINSKLIYRYEEL